MRYLIMPNGREIAFIDTLYPVTGVPLKEDIEKATRLDPFNCPYVRFLIRAYGCTQGVACVLKQYAYADLPHPDTGQRCVMRLVLPPLAQWNVDEYDAGKPFPERPVTFEVPTYSRSLEGKRVAQLKHELKKFREKYPHRVEQKSERVRSKAIAQTKRNAHLKGGQKTSPKRKADFRRRSGSGMIFIRATKSA